MGTYITNIGLLATPRGHSARRGTQQGDVTLLRGTPGWSYTARPLPPWGRGPLLRRRATGSSTPGDGW